MPKQSIVFLGERLDFRVRYPGTSVTGNLVNISCYRKQESPVPLSGIASSSGRSSLSYASKPSQWVPITGQLARSLSWWTQTDSSPVFRRKPEQERRVRDTPFRVPVPSVDYYIPTLICFYNCFGVGSWEYFHFLNERYVINYIPAASNSNSDKNVNLERLKYNGIFYTP